MSRSTILTVFLLFCAADFSNAAAGRVIKVLPQFLDLKGRHTLSPSLYERDAYQAYLHKHPEKRSAIRFAIQWKAKNPEKATLTLRAEVRGVAEGNSPKQKVLEQAVSGGGLFSTWSSLIFGGDEYKQFGEVTAWRVTLWEGEFLLAEQQSFLW